MKSYANIINLPHYEPKYHQRMSIYNRAAQFAPFAALTGYDDAVAETGRLTENEKLLNDDLKNVIDMKLQIIEEHIKYDQSIKVLYFVKDKRKDGGKYIEYSGNVKRIDKINQVIIFKDNTKICFDKILDIKAGFIKEID